MLANDPERRRRIAANARAWVESTLSLSMMAARMGEIYEKRLEIKYGRIWQPPLSSI